MSFKGVRKTEKGKLERAEERERERERESSSYIVYHVILMNVKQ